MKLSFEEFHLFVNSNLNFISREETEVEFICDHLINIFNENNILILKKPELNEFNDDYYDDSEYIYKFNNVILNSIYELINKYLNIDYEKQYTEEIFIKNENKDFLYRVFLEEHNFFKLSNTSIVNTVLSSPYLKEEKKEELYNTINKNHHLQQRLKQLDELTFICSPLSNINIFTNLYKNINEYYNSYIKVSESFNELSIILIKNKNNKETIDIFSSLIRDIKELNEIFKLKPMDGYEKKYIKIIIKEGVNCLANLIKDKYFSELINSELIDKKTRKDFFDIMYEDKLFETLMFYNKLKENYFLNCFLINQHNKFVNDFFNNKNIGNFFLEKENMNSDSLKKFILKKIDLGKVIKNINSLNIEELGYEDKDNALFISTELQNYYDFKEEGKDIDIDTNYVKFINSLHLFQKYIFENNSDIYNFFKKEINKNKDNIPFPIEVLFERKNIDIIKSKDYIKKRLNNIRFSTNTNLNEIKETINFLSIIVSNNNLMKFFYIEERDFYNDLNETLITFTHKYLKSKEIGSNEKLNFNIKNLNLLSETNEEFLINYINSKLKFELSLLFSNPLHYNILKNYNYKYLYYEYQRNFDFLNEKNESLFIKCMENFDFNDFIENMNFVLIDDKKTVGQQTLSNSKNLLKSFVDNLSSEKFIEIEIEIKEIIETINKKTKINFNF